MKSTNYQRGLKTVAALFVVCTISISAQAGVITTGCVDSGSCTLAELFGGGSIEINDVLFDSWSENDAFGDVPDTTSVIVSGVDEVIDGGDASLSTVGLIFDYSPAAEFEFIEYDFDFEASMAGGSSQSIIGASLDLLLFEVVSAEFAFLEINSDLSPGGLLSVSDTTGISDSIGFGSASSVFVDADIQSEIDDPDAGDFASLSRFGYTFDLLDSSAPSVPEPETLVLLALGLMCLTIRRKRNLRLKFKCGKARHKAEFDDTITQVPFN